MPTAFPAGNDVFATPSAPTTTTLSSAGDTHRDHVQHHQDLGDAVMALENNVALLNHDHSGGSGPRATYSIQQQNSHNNADTDLSPRSIHHTLGPHHEQGATGDHTHPQGAPYVPPVAEWIEYNPPLYYGGGLTSPAPPPGTQYPVNLGSGGYSIGHYITVGHHLFLEYNWVWGQPPYFGGFGPVYTFLPPPFITALRGQTHAFAKLFTAPRTGPWVFPQHTGENWLGDAYMPPGSNLMSFAFPWSESRCDLANYVIAQTIGVPNQSVPYIPDGYPEGGELYCRVDCEILNAPGPF